MHDFNEGKCFPAKWFKVYGIFKKLQIDDDKWWDHQIQQFIRIKITSGLKKSPGYLFVTEETLK